MKLKNLTSSPAHGGSSPSRVLTCVSSARCAISRSTYDLVLRISRRELSAKTHQWARIGNSLRLPMKRKLVTSFVLIAALLTLSYSLLAHHGNSAYDEKNPITLKGTVTDFVWANPHTQIYL